MCVLWNVDGSSSSELYLRDDLTPGWLHSQWWSENTARPQCEKTDPAESPASQRPRNYWFDINVSCKKWRTWHFIVCISSIMTHYDRQVLCWGYNLTHRNSNRLRSDAWVCSQVAIATALLVFKTMQQRNKSCIIKDYGLHLSILSACVIVVRSPSSAIR